MRSLQCKALEVMLWGTQAIDHSCFQKSHFIITHTEENKKYTTASRRIYTRMQVNTHIHTQYYSYCAGSFLIGFTKEICHVTLFQRINVIITHKITHSEDLPSNWQAKLRSQCGHTSESLYEREIFWPPKHLDQYGPSQELTSGGIRTLKTICFFSFFFLLFYAKLFRYKIHVSIWLNWILITNAASMLSS